MASLPLKLIGSIGVLALLLVAAMPADAAKARKHKKPVAARTVTVNAKSTDRGRNLFPAGPVYNANDYLGDDPDPFIRLQLQRDIGAHYGGEP